MTVEKPKSDMDAQMNSAEALWPKTVEKAACSSSGPGVKPQGMLTPLQSMARAVAVQPTIVSANTSNMPQRPCSSGESALEEAWMTAAVPKPASFEKALRRRPQCTASFSAKPPAPPSPG